MTLKQQLRQLLRKPKRYQVTIEYTDKDGMLATYTDIKPAVVWHMVKDKYKQLGAIVIPLYSNH
jgi:hypothetical protein